MAETNLDLQLRVAKDQARQAVAEFGSEVKAQVNADLGHVQDAEQVKVSAAKQAHAERLRDAAAARAAEVKTSMDATAQMLGGALQAEHAKQLAIAATATAYQRGAAASITHAQQAAAAITDAHSGRSLATRQATEMERFDVDALGASWVRVRVVQEAQGREMAQLGQAGRAALTGVKGAALDAADALDKGKGSASGFGSELLALATGQAALHALRNVGGAMSSVMKDAADWTAKVAKEFAGTQRSLQSIAALTGHANTTEWALSEATAAAAANVKPEEYTQLRDAFLSRASNYVGAGPTAKLNDADGQKFQQALSEWAASHGVGQADMGSFAGGLLAMKEGPTDLKDMLAEAGKAFATLEASSAPVGHLLPGMTRVMAQGFSASEAAPLLAGLPEVAPEEESTHALRVIAEIRRNVTEGKGDQWGIKKGMRPAEQLEQVLGSLWEGTNEGHDLDTMLRSFTHEDIAANTLRGMFNRGFDDRGNAVALKQWQDILARTPENVIEQQITADRGTSAADARKVDAQKALAESVRGARYAPVERLKLEAETALINEGRFDQPRVEDYARDMFANIVGFGSRPGFRQQVINERAVDMARQRAGIGPGQGPLLQAGASQLTADNMILKAVERQTQLLERQNQLLEQNVQAKKQPGAALVNPPMARGGIRQ